MTCWRSQNIPELQAVPLSRRQSLWREAVSRSNTVKGALASFLLFGLGFLGSDLMAAYLGHATGWIQVAATLLGVLVAYLVNTYGLVQPRARRWLRAHAYTLDRYLGD
ncbi:MAG: hypothetical protein EPN74_02985 [Rhodanobacter sp.]|nr:MAG: hypothetical protein EPN74_02985 [Rhodanobacter sp.]